MKKIIGAVLIGGLLIGAAFADAKFSYTGSNYFGITGNNFKYNPGDREDCLSLTINKEGFGGTVDWDLKADDPDDADTIKLKLDQYYGWMNFGNFQLTAGAWKSRYVNRLIADKGNLDSEDFEYFKPGVIPYGDYSEAAGIDSDNLTFGNVAMIGAYTLADKLPGKLMVKFGAVKGGGYDKLTGNVADPDLDAEDAKWEAHFVGEVAFATDLFAVNFAIKPINKEDLVLSLFGNVFLEKMSFMAGFTFAKQDSESNIGVDLRGRFQVTDAFSITTMHNISSRYDAGDDENKVGMWNMLALAYKIDDKLKAGLTINSLVDDFSADDDKWTGMIITPNLTINATEKLGVTVGVRTSMLIVDDSIVTDEAGGTWNVTIPVIFSINL